jgi:transposase-like protein
MAATARHGTLGDFDSSRKDWPSYTKWLEQCFAANDVEEADKQRAIFLSACGAPTYNLIRSLAAPAKSLDLSYSDIVKLVKFTTLPSHL